MKRHANIPIFIPHLGCPNQCVFCNQRKITGVNSFSPESIRNIIDEALQTIDKSVDTEIAFFGGSFTGIDYSLMCELLEIANQYIKSGRVSSIRCSTRPDYINENILLTLKKYNVKVIELGLQSTDDCVLNITKRGHTFFDEEIACRLIRDHGFSLVGQMMIGLPGATLASEEQTAKFIINSGALAARIYPTVVFHETELCDMARAGTYTPITVDEAIYRSARVLELFRDAGVDVIRIGLCASDNLSDPDSYYAGANHPALGELVENEFYYRKIVNEIRKSDLPENCTVIVTVSSGSLSKAIGQNKKNKLRLMSEYGVSSVVFREDISFSKFMVDVRYEERKNKCI